MLATSLFNELLQAQQNQPSAPPIPGQSGGGGGEAGAALGGSPDTMTVVLWSVVGGLILIVQILMAVWVVKDAQKAGRNPAWAAFVAIPVLGLIGLFIYVIMAPSTGPRTEIWEQTLEEYRQELERQRQEAQEAERRARDAEQQAQEAQNQPPLRQPPPSRDHTTVLNAAPSRVVSLTQYGGQNHGMTFQLRMRAPDGSPMRNKIGKSADCEPSFPEDEAMSGEHCQIFERDGQVVVNDLGSTNGTILERDGRKGKITGQTELKDDDYLVLGSTRLRVQVIEPEQQNEQLPDFHSVAPETRPWSGGAQANA